MRNNEMKVKIAMVATAAMAAAFGMAAQVDANAFRHSCVVAFSGYSGSETLLNFPALVRIPSGSPIYASAKSDGTDIRFADSDGNLVPHEIDTWNPSGESLVWVKVPSLSGTGTTVTLYCGGIAVPDVNPRLVWADAEYKGVWHFSGANADSSTNNLAATESATPPTYNTSGKVGNAFHSDGSGSFHIANDSKWCGYNGNNLTVSAWVKTEALDTFGRVISCRGTSNSSPGFELQMQGNTTRFNAVASDGNSKVEHALYINPLNANADYVYLTAVYKNGTTELFANGESVSVAISQNPGKSNPKPTVSVGTATQVLKIGGMATSNDSVWNGSIDEVRLQWAAQSADWVKADFETQNSSNFAMLGELIENASLKLNKSEFSHKCDVTFSGYDGTSTLYNFPALVRVPQAIASKCGAGGASIRFADADGFLVPHEIDTWNPSGESLVWVCVPRLEGKDTALTMYYKGSPSQNAQPRTVWGSSNYRGVWHFSGSNADSSMNALVGTDTQTAPTYNAAGMIGTAFSGSGSSFFDVANDACWAGYDGNSLSVSAWVKTAVASGYGRVVSCKSHSDNNSGGFELSMQNEASRFNAICGNGAARSQCAQYISPLSAASEYVYLTAVYQNGSILLYANGSFVGRKDDSVAVGKSSTSLRIGGIPTTTANIWNGHLDEVRLQWAAQSADWIAADYATQKNLDFVVFGRPEALRGLVIYFR